MAILQHHLKALKIHKRIRKLEAKAVEQFIRSKIYQTIKKEENTIIEDIGPDHQTLRILKLIFQDRPDKGADTAQLNAHEVVIDQLLQLTKRDSEAAEKASLPIILTAEGDLYRDPKCSYCCSIKKDSQRFKILKIIGNEYVPTATIRVKIGAKSDTAVRKAIGIINAKAKHFLNLDAPLIKSRASQGYRINECYDFVSTLR